jgi:hypothetical protein
MNIPRPFGQFHRLTNPGRRMLVQILAQSGKVGLMGHHDADHLVPIHQIQGLKTWIQLDEAGGPGGEITLTVIQIVSPFLGELGNHRSPGVEPGLQPKLHLFGHDLGFHFHALVLGAGQQLAQPQGGRGAGEQYQQRYPEILPWLCRRNPHCSAFHFSANGREMVVPGPVPLSFPWVGGSREFYP